MRKTCLGLILSLLSSVAIAGDLPTKAAPAPVAPAYPAGFGYYAGIGSFVETSSSSISVNGVSTNLNSAGAAIEAIVGVQYRMPGNNIGFSEVAVNYTNLGGQTVCSGAAGAAVSCSINGPWGFTLTSAIGFNWLYPFQAIPAFASLFGGQSPASLLPAGLVPTTSIPYIAVSADINQVNAAVAGLGGAQVWQATPAFDIGILNYLPNGAAVDTRFSYEFADTSFNITPGTTAKKGGTLRAELSYKF